MIDRNGLCICGAQVQHREVMEHVISCVYFGPCEQLVEWAARQPPFSPHFSDEKRKDRIDDLEQIAKALGFNFAAFRHRIYRKYRELQMSPTCDGA